MDVLDRTDLPFPQSLPEFQRLFSDDAACTAYLERARWGDGFACPHCGVVGEPFRIATRPRVLTCRACRRHTACDMIACGSGWRQRVWLPMGTENCTLLASGRTSRLSVGDVALGGAVGNRVGTLIRSCE